MKFWKSAVKLVFVPYRTAYLRIIDFSYEYGQIGMIFDRNLYKSKTYRQIKFHCEKQPAPFLIWEDRDMIGALCTQVCKKNKCECRKADQLCNSKCLASKSCANK